MGGKAHLLSKYWLLVCLSLCLISPGISLGQEEMDEFMLEDVVVTAEKREVELQKIPMDVSVVRPDDMRMYNINQVYDLQKILPDLSVESQVGTFLLVSIREVQTNMFNPIFETTVATHLDGIQLTRVSNLDNFFFDLERVEILKGPQGTLYGRGATAGSMNMITRKPILGEFSGNASIEAGNYSRYRADVAVNIPMGDTMAMRFAGRRHLFDGYSDSGYGDQDSYSYRLSWRWEPNDTTTIDISGDYVDSYNNGYSMMGDEGYYLTTYGDTPIEIVAQTSEPVVDPRFQSGGPVISRFESRWVFGDALDDNYNDVEQYGITGSFEKYFDFATWTVEYGYRALHDYKMYISGTAWLYPHPFLPSPFPPWVPDTPLIPEPYTQVAVRIVQPSPFTNPIGVSHTNTLEARLTSNTTIANGDPFEWIAGAMGQRDKVTETVNMEYWGYFAQIETDTEAVFVQASWMPIDKWNFTGGLRMNWDEKNYWGINPYPSDPFTYLPDPSSDNFGRVSESWSELTYRFNISYFPTEDIMPYLTYSRGYRSGNIDYGGQIVPPEFLNAWELGLKSRFFDNKLQINAGFYYYDYENYNDWTGVSKCWEDDDDFGPYTPGDHYCDDVGGDPQQGGIPYTGPGTGAPDGFVNMWDYEYNLGYVGYSPGGAEQKGLSMNIEYLPTMDDRVSLAASWRKNEYGDPYDAQAALLALYPDADSPWRDEADLSGHEFGGAPIRGNAAYTHTFRFGSGDMLSATGTLFYEGEGIDVRVNAGWPNEYMMPGREDYWTFDVSFMYSSSRWMPPGNLWSLRFSAQNIFDNDALNSVMYTDDIVFAADDVYPLGSGLMTGRFINPRSYSITLDINF